MSDPSTILVVCTANVCRSPSTALLMKRHLAQNGFPHLADVRTAGTAPALGAGYCPVAARRVGPQSEPVLVAHSGRALLRKDLEDADLVIVLERKLRAETARLCPRAASRTFTLREAVMLAEAVAEEANANKPRQCDLPTLVSEMHAARGATLVPPPERRIFDRLRRLPVVDPLDVPDAHTTARTRHDKVIGLIDDEVARWVTALAASGLRQPG